MNLAFYRAGWRNRTPIRTEQFWVTANGNFLDHCVLEWCKLFADARGKHHWRKIIMNQGEFFDGLLSALRLTEAEFEQYIGEMRTYRDKFVAHLDSDSIMQIPRMRLSRKSVAYLHDYVLFHEDDGGFFPEAPLNAARFYTLLTKAEECTRNETGDECVGYGACEQRALVSARMRTFAPRILCIFSPTEVGPLTSEISR